MRYRPRPRRRASWSFAVMLAASALAPGTLAASGLADRHVRSEPPASTNTTIDLAPALAPDGRFIGRPDLSGAIDLHRWSIVSDTARGDAPRFAPAIATAAETGPWSALGSNGSGNGAFWNAFTIRAIVVSGSDVYVGGLFENAAGIATADNVAKWDGHAWSALGSNGLGDGALDYGAGLGLRALAIYGGNLLVGGNFTDAANVPTADYLAKWNGSAWSGLGSNGAGDSAINREVWALSVSGSNLYAGGEFDNAGGVATADTIAKWNGSAWSALGSNGAGDGAIYPYIAAIAVSGSNVYVAGSFQDAAGIATADRIAKWNGSTWSALGSNGAGDGALNANAFSLALIGSDVYVGGTFVNVAGIATADHIARWNGSSWSALGSNGAGNGALDWDAWELLADGTDLYVGGGYSNAALIPEADYIAKWNGSAWSALGSNGSGNGAINSPVWGLAISPDGGSLYVSGDFDNVAGMPTADRVAKWSLIPFTDIAGSPFEADIIWVYQQGITSGCSATLYCPLASVTRGQMASFLARALKLPNTATDYFNDDNGSTHENNINRVAAAGITSGCGTNKYCPDDPVTRGQMASFLVRALGLTAGASVDAFTDDNGTTHEANINRLHYAGLTSGCTPTTYCPNADVTRGQMAAFLHRAFK